MLGGSQVPKGVAGIQRLAARGSWLAAVLLVLPLACARPPVGPSTPMGSGSVAPAPDCDAPSAAHEPEGCADPEPRPAATGAPPVDRPGVDRDADRVEDLLDVCPDEPEDLDGDRDEDGCPDPDDTREQPVGGPSP